MAGGVRKAQKTASNSDLPPQSTAPALLETSGAIRRKSTRSRKPSAHAQEAISTENIISSDDILAYLLDGSDHDDGSGEGQEESVQVEEGEDCFGDDDDEVWDTIHVATE